jgi:hypothetical protein
MRKILIVGVILFTATPSIARTFGGCFGSLSHISKSSDTMLRPHHFGGIPLRVLGGADETWVTL